MLRIDEAPAIEVHIVQEREPPGGMGETGTSAIVPAVANAIFAATGKRLRKMPVDPPCCDGRHDLRERDRPKIARFCASSGCMIPAVAGYQSSAIGAAAERS